MDLNDVAIVIPARLSSSRLPEKCMLPLGKYNVIQRVYLRAKESGCGRVIVVCDSKKIIDCIQKIGGEAFLTSPDCMSGTDRIAEVTDKISQEYIVNLQGDEPFIQSELIHKVASPLFDGETVMSTLAKKINVKKALNDPNKVKIVLDNNDNALYFSRSVIPFPRDNEEVQTLLHIGIYAYRKDFLTKFVDMPQGRLEKIEKLEQLRVLENSYKIKNSVRIVELLIMK